jgi:hypothetical protein
LEIEIKEKFSLGHPAGYDVYVFEIKYCKNETPVQAADYLGQDFNAKYRAKHFPLTKKVIACENKQPEVGGKCGQASQGTMPRHPVSAV